MLRRFESGETMDLGIAGRWALVCGASKGLGFGCARALSREGVHTLIVARTAVALEEAAQTLRQDAKDGVQVVAVAADITTAEGRERVFDARGSAFDIVVTNAGGPPPGDFHDWDRDAWIAALDANMLTPIALIRATIDEMVTRGFGRIVNITSTAVKAPIDVLGLSNGARSGLTGFVAGLARNPAIASAGVTVNNLLPGYFATDRQTTAIAAASRKTGQTIEAVADARRNAIPARRFGTADEFGELCAFLCSLQAAYVNGQNVLVDGGAYPGTF